MPQVKIWRLTSKIDVIDASTQYCDFTEEGWLKIKKIKHYNGSMTFHWDLFGNHDVFQQCWVYCCDNVEKAVNAQMDDAC